MGTRKGFRVGQTQGGPFIYTHAVLSKFPVTFLCLHTLIYKEGITTVPQNDRAQLQGLELGPKGRAGAPPRQVRGPSAGHPPTHPAVTFQPHELVVALFTQLQLPPVLAQQLLVVAVDLFDGLADLVGEGQRRQGASSTHLTCPATAPLTDSLLIAACPGLGTCAELSHIRFSQ